jgi:hypothetical protein
VIADRKERFAALNAFVTKRNGWLTSIPGAADMAMECLPGSTLPVALRNLGYDVEPTGEGERILPAAIIVKFAAGPDGALQPLTMGSTRSVSLTMTHAGICRVQRYTFGNLQNGKASG